MIAQVTLEQYNMNVMGKKRKVYALVLFIIVGLAALIHASVMIPYGRERCINELCGIFFGDIYRAHDETWYMALSTNLFSSFPFKTPIYAGAPLTGYNYLSSLLMIPFTMLDVPVWIAMYWILPLLWFILFALLSLHLAKAINTSKGFILSFLFFQFFAGSFNFLIRLRNYGNLWEPKVSFLHQSPHFLLNMPMAWSLLAILSLLILMTRAPTLLRHGVYAAFLIFVGFGLKFYAGIAMVLLWGSYIVFTVLRERRWMLLITLGFPAILSIVISVFFFYDPLASLATGSIFIFQPFAITHLTIEDKDYFYLPDLVLQRYYLYAHGISPRLIAIEALTVFLTIFFSFGTRIIGFMSIVLLIVQKKITIFYLSVMNAMLILFLLFVLFIQKGVWTDTSQFATFARLLSNVFAAYALYTIAQQRIRWLAMIGVVLIVLFTIHNAIDIVKVYYLQPNYAYIPSKEVQALNVLRKLPRGVVFVFPHKRLQIFNHLDSRPVILWKAADSSYVAAYSNKPLWYADQFQMQITGVQNDQRETLMRNIDTISIKNISARYFYLTKEHPDYVLMDRKLKYAGFPIVFENSEVRLYEHRSSNN